jgi:hypothetical protein
MHSHALGGRFYPLISKSSRNITIPSVMSSLQTRHLSHTLRFTLIRSSLRSAMHRDTPDLEVTCFGYSFH